MYAHNTSKHESTKFTPFEAMFGRVAVLRVDFTHASHQESGGVFDASQVDNALEELTVARTSMLEHVKNNILSAQDAQKKASDRRHANPEVFKIGAMVLKKDITSKKRAGGKLNHKWTGHTLYLFPSEEVCTVSRMSATLQKLSAEYLVCTSSNISLHLPSPQPLPSMKSLPLPPALT